jgi:hypothetical protein
MINPLEQSLGEDKAKKKVSQLQQLDCTKKHNGRIQRRSPADHARLSSASTTAPHPWRDMSKQSPPPPAEYSS